MGATERDQVSPRCFTGPAGRQNFLAHFCCEPRMEENANELPPLLCWGKKNNPKNKDDTVGDLFYQDTDSKIQSKGIEKFRWHIALGQNAFVSLLFDAS